MTSFQKRVYKIVKQIPRGEVLSYKEVARLAGKLRAWRAVGNILNKNQDPKIPCHRVIRFDGGVGGYRSGQRRKIELLKKEGLKVRSSRKVEPK